MTYLACTTCNAAQWRRYGKRMVQTFVRFWPSSVPLWVYAEGFDDDQAVDRYVELDAAAPWLKPWQAGCGPEHHGAANGAYDYQRDAVRFSFKVAAIAAAAGETTADVLIWLDADTVTHDHVSLDWLDRLFPEDSLAPLAWLDRADKYPECGFVMYRLPQARPLISALVETYTTGRILEMPGRTDCHALQHVVRAMGIEAHSLSGNARTSAHPFVNSPLGEFLDHLKGPRKELGRSRQSDLIRPRAETYWRT